MSAVFQEDGTQVPVTVLKVDDCRVVAQRTQEKDGYTALQLGVGTAKVKNVSKQMRGHFAKAKVEPARKLAEFVVEADGLVDVGAPLKADHFVAGQFVDIVGTTKGKGFAGVMKRHGFAGVSASHGAHRNHRKPGSIGACATPGRVFKGLRMAGHMGDRQRTQQNLEIVRTDDERGLIFVKGSVPGSKGGWLIVKDAVKVSRHADAPFPASIKAAANNNASAEPAPEATESQEG